MFGYPASRHAADLLADEVDEVALVLACELVDREERALRSLPARHGLEVRDEHPPTIPHVGVVEAPVDVGVVVPGGPLVRAVEDGCWLGHGRR